MCNTYPTCRIAVYSLGYALGAGSRSSPTHHGGDTTPNVPNLKTRITSSKVSTTLNAIIFISNAKKNDTDTTTSAGGKTFRNASLKLQSEYLALFEKFKSDLADQKEKLQSDNATACRTNVNNWLEKIIRARSDLEKKF